MDQPIRVLVVDDDFMIANLHGKFVDSIEGYQWVGSANNYSEALQKVEEINPHLVLLDVYMPDQSGIQLLRTIRFENKSCDVIMITAAKESGIVEEGFRLGIFDYLIKPFDLDQLQESLNKYIQFRSRLSSTSLLDQNMVADLKNLRSSHQGKAILADVQKGIDVRTVEKFKKSLAGLKESLTVEQISNLTGVSRSTARTYLNYLVEENWIEEELQYGTVGRPLKLYQIKF